MEALHYEVPLFCPRILPGLNFLFQICKWRNGLPRLLRRLAMTDQCHSERSEKSVFPKKDSRRVRLFFVCNPGLRKFKPKTVVKIPDF